MIILMGRTFGRMWSTFTMSPRANGLHPLTSVLDANTLLLRVLAILFCSEGDMGYLTMGRTSGRMWSTFTMSPRTIGSHPLISVLAANTSLLRVLGSLCCLEED